MPTIAFLFRGDELRVTDLDLIYDGIFKSVLSATPEGNFHLSSGAILLDRFSSRITSVGSNRVAGHSAISWTVSDEKKLRATIAVTFAQSACARYHRLEAASLPRVLLTQSIECVTISDTTLLCADQIHQGMTQELPCYLGCFEVDRGDPLALELAANGLIPFCHYRSRTLEWIVPFDHDTPDSPETAWARKLPFMSVELTTRDPDLILREQISPQGEKSVRLLKGRARSPHAEDVLIAFRNTLQADRNRSEFHLERRNSEKDAWTSVSFANTASTNNTTSETAHRGMGGIKPTFFVLCLALRKTIGVSSANNWWLDLSEG